MRQFYKESVNILGMSIDELMDDFVAPQQQQPQPLYSGTASGINHHPNAKAMEQQLEIYLDKLLTPGFSIDDSNISLCDAIEKVFDLCVRMVREI